MIYSFSSSRQGKLLENLTFEAISTLVTPRIHRLEIKLADAVEAAITP